MPSNSFTAIVIIGGIALLIGLFGGGVQINQITLPHLSGWQRVLSVLIGIVLIVLGLVLDPSVRNPMAEGVTATASISMLTTPVSEIKLSTPTTVAVAQLPMAANTSASTNKPTAVSMPTSTDLVLPTAIDTPLPTKTPILSTNTSAPAATFTPVPTDNSIAKTAGGGSCDSIPVNPIDGITINLNDGRWYLIEDYDNIAVPAVHKFIVQLGSSVIANSGKGQRAWGCRNESAARSEAQRVAQSMKVSNPSFRVYNPNGNEITN